MGTQISSPLSTNSVNPQYVYNAASLRRYLDLLIECAEKQDILRKYPYSTNYIIYSSFCCFGRPTKYCLVHVVPKTILANYLTASDLTDDCEIGFNYEQQMMLEKIEKKTRQQYAKHGLEFNITQIKSNRFAP